MKHFSKRKQINACVDIGHIDFDITKYCLLVSPHQNLTTECPICPVKYNGKGGGGYVFALFVALEGHPPP